MWRRFFSQTDLSCTHFRRYYVERPINVASLLNTGARPNLENMDFLPCGWKESIKQIETPPLRAENWKVVKVECIVPLFVCIGDLRVCS